MELVADPPHGIGPIRIGMTFDEAMEAMRGLPGYIGEESSDLSAQYESGMTVSVEVTRSGPVKSVEVYAPDPDSGWHVVMEGMSLFGEPADAVLNRLSALSAVEVTEGGCQAIAHELLLALWRPTVPEYPGDRDGRFFQAILVARPGYYEDYGEPENRINM